MNIFSFINYFFPPICLHCDEKIMHKRALFCISCIHLFTLSDDYHSDDSNVASVFDKESPINTLLHAVEIGKYPSLIKVLAAYFVIQFNKMKWPMPDSVMAISKKKIFFFNDFSVLLAKQVALFLEKPFYYKKKKNTVLFIGDVLDKQSMEKIPKKNSYLLCALGL